MKELELISKLPLEIREQLIEEQLNKLSIEGKRRICGQFAIDLLEAIVLERMIERNLTKQIIRIKNEFENINPKKKLLGSSSIHLLKIWFDIPIMI